MQQKQPMPARPSPRSSDGLRPRSKSGASAGAGRPPSSPRTSDAPRQSIGRSSASSDKPMPSFLRPTVSSSLHSSTSSSSLTPSSSSKGLGAAAKQSADKAPAVPRPITPKEKAAPATSSRWSAASLMQKASNAIKGTKTGSKASKEVAPSSSGKEAARRASSVKVAASTAASSSGKVAMRQPASAVPVKEAAKSVSSKEASSDPKAETAIAEPVEERHQQPETHAESSPPAVQAEKAALEPTAVENEQNATTSQEVAGTDITAAEETEQTEQVRAEQPTTGSAIEEIVEEEKQVMNGAEAMNVETPEPQEQNKPQSSAVAEAETETHESTGDDSPTVAAEAGAKEVATLEAAKYDPATSMVEKTVVEESKAEEKPQEEVMKPEDLRENTETSVVSEEPKEETSVTITEEPREETSVIAEEPKEETSKISEEPKEETSVITEESKEETSMTPEQPKEEASLLSEQSNEDPPPVEKQVEMPEGPELSVASSATDAPEDEETSVPKQASASEPVTLVQEAVSTDRAVIETLPSASEPATPAITVERAAAGASPRQTTVPEDSSKLAFKGSKVKTAMEKRSEEEQPEKKEVARSNDVIEETKSRLLEKRKSKVKALVGAFETVMDSPPSSS
jgi:hypothetical protein